MVTRRELLKLIISAVLMVPVVAACGSNSSEPATDEPAEENSAENGGMPDGSTGALLRSKAPLPEPFSVPLPIPPRLKPVHRDATSDYYESTQRPANLEILPGLTTPIWGYNGLFPGPTIASRRGRQVVVRHRNELPVPTVVHLHGAKTAPADDGYPTDLLLPTRGWQGETPTVTVVGIAQGSRDYHYALDQPAATLWYHDHRMDFTGPQVYYGLAGFHLLHDDEEEQLPLPKGERDIPLMICDRSFTEEGGFAYPAIDPLCRPATTTTVPYSPVATPLLGKHGVQEDFMNGVLGDVNLVNGAAFLEVTRTRYRFRLLNACNARNYRLVLDPAGWPILCTDWQ